MVGGRISWSLVAGEVFENQQSQEKSSCSYSPLRRLISHVTCPLMMQLLGERRDHSWY